MPYISIPIKKLSYQLWRQKMQLGHSLNLKKPIGMSSYSRFVFFMKFLLPSIAFILVGLVLVWPEINLSKKGFSLKFSAINRVNPEQPAMINARFVGTDSKNQPYSITADLAKNILLGGSSLELEMPKADIAIKDGTWLAIIANTGVYDQNKKTLMLNGSVNLFHDTGYEFNTESATIDINKGIASSNSDVTGQGPFGNLSAEGLKILNKGGQFLFSGKSKLTIYPDSKK